MRGGGGVLSALDPTRKAGGGGGGGGGVSASGPIRKAGGGGCCPALQARYKKRGRGRGCLAEEGALPYMKGGVATPKPPPPPWIRLCRSPPPPPSSMHHCIWYCILNDRTSTPFDGAAAEPSHAVHVVSVRLGYVHAGV